MKIEKEFLDLIKLLSQQVEQQRQLSLLAITVSASAKAAFHTLLTVPPDASPDQKMGVYKLQCDAATKLISAEMRRLKLLEQWESFQRQSHLSTQPSAPDQN